MRIEIAKIAKVNPKHFNFKLKKSFEIDVVYHTDDKVVILGDFTAEQEQEIKDLYSEISSQEWHYDLEFMNEFTAEKYSINEEKGRGYKHKISGTLSNMVTAGLITLDQANLYGDGTKKVRENLNDGYWHSAYTEHIKHTPIPELEGIHEEVRIYIRDYVNDKYPTDFQIP